VLRVLPRLRHRDGTVVRRVRVPAHVADDPLGERDPDLLVVLELGVAPDALHRPLARGRVALGVELEAEALAEPLVALGPELRPRARDREVDVEENSANQRLSRIQAAVSA